MNDHVHPIFADILKTFAPIPCPLPDHRKAGPHSPPPVLEFARAEPNYEAADDVADYAQTLRKPIPADPDDVFSEDDDDDTEDVAELLAARPVLPSGKWVGIGVDACAALIELQKLIGELDFFSPGDTGLGRLQQASERANVILQRAGYRNGNAA